MSKRVLMIGGNFHPEPTGIGKYNGEMIDWFAGHNYECTVITTFPYYPQWKVQEPYSKKCFWFKKETRKISENSKPIQIIRCPHYVPQNPSGLKRLISDFTFLFSSYLVVVTMLFSKKMDYVITVAPSFSTGLLGILYKKIRGARFLYHIQDLQIDAARDLKIIKSPYFLRMLFGVERFILKESDFVSTISSGMIQKVKEKCDREIVYFPNWVDTNSFYPCSKETAKQEYGFNSSDKIVLYSGAIGFKQELESIIHTAKSFELKTDVKFVICGSGPYKIYLEDLARNLGLNNVTFMPLQPSDNFNTFLNMADVHLVLQKKDTADLVMPSKLTTIFSVGGLAIVTASSGTSLYNVMNLTNLGILIEPENQRLLSEAIVEALAVDTTDLSKNARVYAEKYLSTNNILYNYAEQVFKDPPQHQHEISGLFEQEIKHLVMPITTKARLNAMNE